MYKAPAATSLSALALTGSGTVALIVAAFTLVAAGLALCTIFPKRQR